MNPPDVSKTSHPFGPPPKTANLETLQEALMSGSNGALLEKESQAPAPLTAQEDARELVRLIQCPHCSKPLRNPVTLPCSNTSCRECLPEAYSREHISYPDMPGRRHALRCSFSECGREHPTAECNVDVTLAKIMESVAEVIARHTSVLSNVTTTVEENASWNDEVNEQSEKGHLHQLLGGRLVATYTLASQGQLDWRSDVTYSDESEASRLSDQAVRDDLLVSVQKEVDCQVCYSVMLDPVTTFCGHTLCRNCLVRVLDHSLHCPVCRRTMVTPPSLHRQSNNKTLVNLLIRLCPELIAARAEAVAAEEYGSDGHSNVPLFVCTLGFPNQPTFLRIFEPRYRLMLRRCLEGNQQFGILMYNRYAEPQGDLGSVHFYRYGTMLQILQAQMTPDGQSLVELRGLYRFRVKSHGVVDGYSIGDIERVDDVSLAEEERIEAEETATPPTEQDDVEQQINRTSTQGLLEIGRTFIERMQSRSAIWLQQRVLDAHGEVPDDPAEFPYWFASVLPISDEEKYKLLSTTTVRERLKITAGWIRRIETQRWYQSNACRIL